MADDEILLITDPNGRTYGVPLTVVANYALETQPEEGGGGEGSDDDVHGHGIRYVPPSPGDSAGRPGGLASGTNMTPAGFSLGSWSVRVGGQPLQTVSTTNPPKK